MTVSHARSNGVRRYRDFLPVCAFAALGFLGGWYGFSKRGDVAIHAIPEPARSFTGTQEVAKEVGARVSVAASPQTFDPPLSEDSAQRSAELAVEGAAAAAAAAAMADGANSK